MSNNYTPEEGDYVRVVIEGEVKSGGKVESGSYGNWFEVGDHEIWPGEAEIVSVEKVDLPLEYFGPGDTVRSKAAPAYIYTIGQGGYLCHFTAYWATRPTRFTSKDYERVEIK